MSRLRQILSLALFLIGMSALSVLALPSESLDKIRTRIERAQDQGAAFKAPMSLRNAENELQRAEEALAAKPIRPPALEQALEMADYRSELLSLVLAEIRAANYRINEETALRRLEQRRPTSISPEPPKQVIAELK